MAKETKEKKKERRPQAAKRMIQNEKARLRNRSFKAKLRTAVRQFDQTLPAGDVGKTQESLNQVYSLMDKGVKRGVIQKNKASRTKSRLSARLVAKS
jgi:small subunit ribosomal protein S20